MQVEMAFGRDGLALGLPDGFRYTVLHSRSAEPLADAPAALGQALENPIASPPLRELARGRRSAAISVCDITRPAPNAIVLPPLLARLEEAGIARENVTLFIATGLHRPATAEEIREILGAEIAGCYRIVNHDARRLEEHRFLGHTRSGTPVYIDERFLAADLHITLGFIEPHFMLGYSGGRKLIVPGLAGEQTIRTLHSPRFMREPRATLGSIDENPLHHEFLEIAGMAGHHFLVDVALARDRRIAAVFAGEPVEAHRCGTRFVADTILQRLPEPVDAVITSSAGYPLDLTFYQSVKGICSAAAILKPGGRILLLSACEEGPGAAEFRRMLKEFPSPEAFLRHIDSAPVEVDQWQLEKLALAAGRAEISYFVPGLAEEYRATLWGKSYATAEQALAGFLGGLPLHASVAVIPEGPYVLAEAEFSSSDLKP